MPYIVTTKRQCGDCLDEWACGECDEGIKSSRRAVATLEEARTLLIRSEHGGSLSTALLDTLPGTIGPLPDGTVIEVKPCEDCALDRLCIWHEWPLREVQGQPE
jgi:hypothetical protein